MVVKTEVNPGPLHEDRSKRREWDVARSEGLGLGALVGSSVALLSVAEDGLRMDAAAAVLLDPGNSGFRSQAGDVGMPAPVVEGEGVGVGE